ncbi:MAG: beta-lactamase [Pseudonocardiales bacterium]|nr:beta-lactamase [Pseudonocardiales bacterium]
MFGQTGALISGVLVLLGCVVLAIIAAGYLRVVVHRPVAVRGDGEMAAELGRLAGRRTRRLAAAVIDLGDPSRTRTAFIDADQDTRFEIGSITKGLTGMLLAEAIGRGEVTLETAIAALVPETATSPVGSLTMRELCTHTSGLPRLPRTPVTLARLVTSGWFGTDPYRHTTPSGVLAAARRQRLLHRGGYRYSNLGAAVLGHALARAAGTDYPTLLADRVLTPLGMHATGPSRDQAIARGWAASGRRPRAWLMNGYGPAGGGIISTVTDISLLASALLDRSAPGQAAVGPIGRVEPDRPRRSAGMFWVIDEDPSSHRTMVWHNGQTGGYSAFIALYPHTRRAVVVLANVARAADQQRIAIALARWLVRTPPT